MFTALGHMLMHMLGHPGPYYYKFSTMGRTSTCVLFLKNSTIIVAVPKPYYKNIKFRIREKYRCSSWCSSRAPIQDRFGSTSISKARKRIRMVLDFLFLC